MITIFKKIAKFNVFLILLLFISACSSQESKNQLNEKTSFSNKFNIKFNDDALLLSCIVYKYKVTNKISLENNDDCLIISGTFTTYYSYSKNVDSLINSYINENSNIDFASKESMISLNLFIQNYRLVNNQIFADIETDENTEQMKLLESKIFKVPKVAAIYRKYIGSNQDLSSLSSNGGVALSIQLAYYFSTLSESERNKVLKALL